MIKVRLGRNSTPKRSRWFDIYADTEGEITFVVSTLNTLCPHVLQRWDMTSEEASFYSTQFERYEIMWCIDDESGWPLAYQIYSYIESFGFDVEIVKENGED